MKLKLGFEEATIRGTRLLEGRHLFEEIRVFTFLFNMNIYS